MIGKSTGAEIQFQVKETNQLVNIYTTRPDTIYGASFIAVSINHPLVNSALGEEEIKEIKEEFSKNDDEKIKLGIPLNLHCRHPLLDKDLPIYIANFVLDNYGEGAIFGCPAHDERDFEFAQKYELPIIKVLDCPDEDIPYLGDGKMINSEELNGLDKNQAINKAIELFEKLGSGKKAVNYKLRDWGVSRQRYWGCPIPVIYYEDGTYRVLEKNELPVLLPYDVDLNGKGNALLRNDEWRKLPVLKQEKLLERNRHTRHLRRLFLVLHKVFRLTKLKRAF